VTQVSNGPDVRSDAERTWSDSRLVSACRDGNEKAWAALIEKYKNLVFSIPIKYGLSRADAADIFQAVCLDLLTELPRLRNPTALPKWLIETTSHKCWRSRRQEERYAHDEEAARRVLELPAPADAMPEETLREVQREQAVRSAIGGLPPRCRQMITMLFFETPPRPYADDAGALGVRPGSIGFLRLRCLRRLRRQLEKAGV
jgi:RNA polymerase sigma factor (sigma-70 family)